ncbi:MAG: hypothetical protein CMK59_03155 [Proteobacteria bacterium]|nr:hypothetical protein [Pseudomonadota bacterium]
MIALGSAAVPITAALKAYSWWNIPADAPFKHLSIDEATQVRRIAESVFPSGETIALDGGSAKLDRFLDELIDQFGSQEVSLIKFMLHGIEPMPFPIYGTTFSSLSSTNRLLFLQSWLHHDNHLVRNAMMSIVTLLGMGYTCHPDVSPLISTHHKCGFG